MTESNFTDDIFLHLSHRPRYILDGVILDDESKTLAFKNIQHECQLSLGRLDNLPLSRSPV